MKLSLKQIIAGTLLAAAASTPALAFDTSNGADGNGSLVVTVYDQVLGLSVIQDLGINYLDFLNSSTSTDGRTGTDVTPDEGLTLTFSVDLSWFTSQGSDLSNLEYTISAFDTTGIETARNALVSASTSTTVTAENSDVIAPGSYYSEIALRCGNEGMDSVCTGVLSPTSGIYTGGNDWGDNLQYLNFSASATVGSALGMYSLIETWNEELEGVVAGESAASSQYANSLGVAATWLLSADGTLTWSSASVAAVPLPAAVWLLLSGLGGLGVIGRRRTAVAAA